MAYKIFAFIENQDGPVEGPNEDGSIELFEIEAKVSMPYDFEKKGPKGTRKFKPVKIVFEKGPHSPILMKTLCSGQTCPEIKINWMRNEPDGRENVYYSTTFRNAKLIRMKEWMPLTKVAGQEKMGHLESISIVAEERSWLYEPKNILYTEQALKGRY